MREKVDHLLIISFVLKFIFSSVSFSLLPEFGCLYRFCYLTLIRPTSRTVIFNSSTWIVIICPRILLPSLMVEKCDFTANKQGIDLVRITNLFVGNIQTHVINKME